jgi:hypothetical protein
MAQHAERLRQFSAGVEAMRPPFGDGTAQRSRTAQRIHHTTELDEETITRCLH